jgi:ribosomal-protein-alanine N-acetyltransferase
MIDVSFTPFPFLTTENYSLRNLMPADEQEIFALRSSDEINKYLNRMGLLRFSLILGD